MATTTSAAVRAPRLDLARRAWALLTPPRRDVALLVTLGILARGLTAALIHHPGYIDAAYYYAVARNVAAGRGLTEDFIVTYLAPAAHVVHPSNLWWMPGASLLLIPFFWVFGASWWVALLPNVLLTGALPALAYALGRDLLGTRRAALGAGLLVVTSGYYYPLYDPMPDNFGLYAWAAGGALLLMGQGVRGRPRRFALAGLACGVAHLARAEAPLLLLVAVAVWLLGPWLPALPTRGAARRRPHLPVWSLAALLGLYLAVMAPWFARDLLLVGAPLPPGGLRAAWLRDYDDFFSYGLPLTPATYLAWGPGPILWSKLSALAVVARQLAAVMDFALAPFALLGVWRLRRAPAAWPWLLYGLGAYLVLCLVFTFPSVNGTALHSEVAVLPFLDVAAVAGLDAAIAWVGRRTHAPAARTAERRRVYLGAAIALSAMLSLFLVLANAHAWDATAAAYVRAGRVVAADWAALTPGPSPAGRGERGTPAGGGEPEAEGRGTNRAPGRAPAERGQPAGPVVMVADPANYFVDAGQPAIVIPDQGLPVMLAAARRYGARYLVLEPVHSPAQDALWAGRQRTPLLTPLYAGPDLRVYRWNW